MPILKEIRQQACNDIDEQIKVMYEHGLEEFISRIHEHRSGRLDIYEMEMRIFKEFDLVKLKNNDWGNPLLSVLGKTNNSDACYEHEAGVRGFLLDNDASIKFKNGFPKVIGAYGKSMPGDYLIHREMVYNQNEENTFVQKYAGKILKVYQAVDTENTERSPFVKHEYHAPVTQVTTTTHGANSPIKEVLTEVNAGDSEDSGIHKEALTVHKQRLSF